MTRFGMFGFVCSAALFATSTAFALPKATEIYPKMGLGWNLGNTMEVPSDPTAWGNIVPTAAIVNGVKAAGFTTVRIPCAWYSHSDALEKDIAANNGSADNTNYTHVGKAADFTNPTIDAAWLKQVKDVVDMFIAEGMYVVLNSHWDEGWLEDRVYDGTASPRRGANNIANKAATTKARQTAYWKQIATYFKDYDEHLLFAGANEPGVNDPWNGTQWEFDNTRMQVLKDYYDAFITAVRSTGGNNDTRTLILQTPRTEIDMFQMLANNYPEDPAGKGYTMVEAHFYPYQFSLMTADESWGKTFWYWEDKTNGVAERTCSGSSLGSKQSIDNQFKKLQVTFADEGIPVVIGEMGANKRFSLKGTEGFDLDAHLEAIAAWYGYTVASAKSHGIVPIIWDTGYEGEGNTKDHMTIIRRQASNGSNLGTIVDELTMNAIKTQFEAAKAYEGPKEGPAISESDKALWVEYHTKVSTKSETGRISFKFAGGADWSAYTAISFDIRTEPVSVTGCEGDEKNGCNGYAWTSIGMYAQSGSTNTWTDYSMGNMNDYSGLVSNVNVKLQASSEKSTEALSIADPTKVNSWGIDIYATQLVGTIYLNNILLHKADGTVDTLASFDTAPANIETSGIASQPTYIQANAKGTGPAMSIATVRSVAASKMFVNVQHGMVSASFTAATTAPAKAMLLNSLGQVIAQQNFTASKGANRVELSSDYRGPAMLMVRQGSQRYMQKVILK